MGIPLYHKDDNDATDDDDNDEDDGYSLQKVRCTDWRKLICRYYQRLSQNIFFCIVILISKWWWQSWLPGKFDKSLRPFSVLGDLLRFDGIDPTRRLLDRLQPRLCVVASRSGEKSDVSVAEALFHTGGQSRLQLALLVENPRLLLPKSRPKKFI